MNSCITVFLPYYKAQTAERREEYLYCLSKNIESKVNKIYLMIDDGYRPEITSDKITIIDIEKRPTYLDWVKLTEKYVSDGISVLINTDIYFDDSLSRLFEIFESDPYSFVALSRYEASESKLSKHPNPQWSQDFWAINSHLRVNDSLKKLLDIPLGMPRCDNKVAYLFAIHGHKIYNPINFVKSIHVHESAFRTYDKHQDLSVLGGTAWVYPSEELTSPSKLVMDFWALPSNSYSELRQNTTFNYEKGLPATTSKLVKANLEKLFSTEEKSNDNYKIKPNLIAYDAEWQYPAITEKHAYYKMLDFYEQYDGTKAVYFAFPWASYIDSKLHNKKDQSKADILERKLHEAATLLKNYEMVITVCQHIKLLQFEEIFASIGITDIFWSHAEIGEHVTPKRNIGIHPFPLYPVQVKPAEKKKKYVFTFVGAKSPSYYLTDSRNLILDHLAKTPGGYVKGRETWHYNKIVYDHQIRNTAELSNNIIDVEQTEEFKNILSQSVFSLCPSGTGPNSIRLWESIESGVIPVVLADTYQPPCSDELWESAVFKCKEDLESIKNLPNVLNQAHQDYSLLETKRKALKQLSFMYGPNYFVYDILKLILKNGGLKNQISKSIELDDDSRVKLVINEGLNEKLNNFMKEVDQVDQVDNKDKKMKILKLNTLVLTNYFECKKLLLSDMYCKKELRELVAIMEKHDFDSVIIGFYNDIIGEK